jgi:hypothetical protein
MNNTNAMDSLPVEIIKIIFMFVNPKDYTNFILSYDVALCFWRNKKTREKYKEQYLRDIREDFADDPGTYVIKTIRVDNGKNHGKYIEYYKNGQMRINKTYRNIRDKSQIHGKYTSYYKNGRICENMTYQNSQIHGKYTRYYENGQVCTINIYERGKLVKNIKILSTSKKFTHKNNGLKYNKIITNQQFDQKKIDYIRDHYSELRFDRANNLLYNDGDGHFSLFFMGK